MRSLVLLLLLFSSTPSLARAACGTVEDALPPPYDGLVRGEVALEAGRLDEASAALEATTGLPDGPAARRRAVLLGRTRVLTGDFDGATSILGEALTGDRGKGGARASRCDGDPAEARWWIAQAAVRAGDLDAAIQTWRALWAKNPTSPRSADAELLLTRHDPAWTDSNSDEKPKVALERFTSLGVQNQHKEALAVLEAHVPDDGSRRYRSRMARALFRAREYRRAVTAFGALANPTPQDRFDRALAASRYGDYALAGELYGALVDELHGLAETRAERRLVDTASFKLGYLDYDAGRLEEGLKRFEEHLARLPGSRHADEAHWFTGWSRFKQGNHAAADAAFGRLITEHGGSSLAAGARYWKARIAGIRGDAEAERSGLKTILSKHPDTGYAWWASRRLDMRWAAPAAPDPVAGDGKEYPALRRSLDLLEAGLDDWAATELSALAAGARKKGRAQSLHLAGKLVEAGEWAAARRLARPYCGPAHERRDIAALQICWPRPEARATAEIDEALPALLPFAIMRAESAYQPTISSAAGARGLMQLMPELGVALHAERSPGAAPLNPDDLFIPAVNVTLGTAELSELSRDLADTGVAPRLPLVIAGYNGGEEAVRRWLAAQPTPVEADRWAEDIGYTETRRYVRRVLGTLQIYRYVYGD